MPEPTEKIRATKVKEVNASVEPVAVTSEYKEARPQPAPVRVEQVQSGSKTQQMAAAGIPQSDWQYVDSILTRESGWRHTVWNTTGSGAYGLCQSLPATKMASAGADYMTNPITQLRWCHGYAQERYGSWAAAYNFWNANKWW